ncbi:MAG: hypothetical protein WBD22_07145 [Pyrinomonadaceae bacterium]
MALGTSPKRLSGVGAAADTGDCWVTGDIYTFSERLEQAGEPL